MRQVWVCQYRDCQANGAEAVLAAFRAIAPADIEILAAECQGQCNLGPTVRILPDETWYCRIKPDQVAAIVEQHFMHGEPVQAYLHPRLHPSRSPFGD